MLRNLSKFRFITRRLQQAATPWAWPEVRYLSSVPDVKSGSDARPTVSAFPTSSEPGRVRMFRYLNLKTFADDEIAAAHIVLAAHAHTYGTKASTSDADSELIKIAQELNLIQPVVAKSSAGGISESSTAPAPATAMQVLPLTEFQVQLKKVGEQLDNRVWPMVLSFVATGLSIGIIIPILPILVKEIHIPTSVFGVAVASFGLAKLIVRDACVQRRYADL